MSSILPVTSGLSAHWPVHTAPVGSIAPRVSVKDARFDQVAFSTGVEGEQRFRMDLVSRLSQEVRTATTSGDIQTIARQISSGVYKPDATETAARILLMKGAEA